MSGAAAQRVSLLKVGLDAMVPLRMWELRNYPLAQLEAMAPDLADYLAGHGDEIEHGGQSQGEGVSRLVTALAVLALIRPEGVSAFGGHWRDSSAEAAP